MTEENSQKQIQQLRIIFITHYAELYGANRSLLDLINGLSKFGLNDALLIAPKKGDLLSEAAKYNIACRVIPFVNETHKVYQKPSLAKAKAKKIYNRIITILYSRSLKQKNKKLIIHSNSSATLIGYNFSRLLKAPHVWHIREFGLQDYNFEYNFNYDYFQACLSKAHTAIAISKAVYEKRVANCSASNKTIIYNGVIFKDELQKNKTTISTQNNNASAVFTFGIIGLISKEKNQLDAIEALRFLKSENKNVQLLIAGNYADGDYFTFLNKKIEDYNLQQNAQFLGFLKNTNGFYNKINCLLICSKHEAFGRVTIEAMSYGIPVIGFNNAGTAEIIQDKYNGLLYYNGASELAEKMNVIISNKEVLKNLQLNALQTVEKNFTIDSYAQAVLNVYLNALQNYSA